MKVFIKSCDSISAQPTFNSEHPVVETIAEGEYFNCIKPEYKQYINPKLLRRMSPIIRNGVTCSMSVLQKVGIESPDAIIVGTALGCIKDTAAFLQQLIEGNEELPNPTHFIQSTHNTIAGQIALLLKCKNYNFTFSQNHLSFETALLDAQICLAEGRASNVLVGGVDEITEVSYPLMKNLDCYRNSTIGEGAGFFILDKEEGKVCIEKLEIVVSDDFNLSKTLEEIGISANEIDIFIGGDQTNNDAEYADASTLFNGIPYLMYKPFVGEYGTVSAVAMCLASKMIENQEMDTSWQKNKAKAKSVNKILLYNKVGNEHSIILLSKA